MAYSVPDTFVFSGQPATSAQQKILALLVGPAAELQGRFDFVNGIMRDAEDRQSRGQSLAPWHAAAVTDYQTLRAEENHLGAIVSQYGLDRFNVENAASESWMWRNQKNATSTSLLNRDILKVVEAAYTPREDMGRHGIEPSIGPVDIGMIVYSGFRVGWTAGEYALARFAPQFATKVAMSPAMARFTATTAYGRTFLRSIHPVATSTLSPAGSGLATRAGQLTDNACGMACGQRLLANQGIKVYQSNLANGFYKGLSPENLAKNMNQFQLGWKGFYGYPTAQQLTKLVEARGQLVARVGSNPGHFVNVESIKDGVVHFWDPNGGVVKNLPVDDFADIVSGLVHR